MLKSNFISSRQNHAMVRRSWNKSHSPGHTNDCGSWSLIGRSHTLERCMRIESQINLTCVAARIECVRQRNGTHPRKLARRARGELLWPPVPAAETLGQTIYAKQITRFSIDNDMTTWLMFWFCDVCNVDPKKKSHWADSAHPFRRISLFRIFSQFYGYTKKGP